MDAFSATWLFSFVRDNVELCKVDGACHVGNVETVCWSMESVRMWKMCSVRADRAVRCVGVGRAENMVDGGGACMVRV